MSSVTTFSCPAIRPAQMPPIRPATGPDMSRLTGRWVADSTVAIPPEDCISCTPRRKPSSCIAARSAPRSATTFGPTYALRHTVEKRSNSR